MTRIMIVAGVRLYLDGLADLVRRHENLEVMGTFETLEQAMAAAARSLPHVMLVDLAQSEGLLAVSTVRSVFPSIQVVALNVSEDPREVLSYAEAGVCGYVPRGGSLVDLTRTLAEVMQGEFRCSGKIAASLLQRIRTLSLHQVTSTEPSRLTRREMEVAQLIDLGLSNKEIAARLCIEVSTVKNHVHKVLEKSNARRRGEAAARLRPRLDDFTLRSAAMHQKI